MHIHEIHVAFFRIKEKIPVLFFIGLSENNARLFDKAQIKLTVTDEEDKIIFSTIFIPRH